MASESSQWSAREALPRVRLWRGSCSSDTLRSFDYPRPYRIEDDVADQVQQMALLLDEEAFEAP